MRFEVRQIDLVCWPQAKLVQPDVSAELTCTFRAHGAALPTSGSFLGRPRRRGGGLVLDTVSGIWVEAILVRSPVTAACFSLSVKVAPSAAMRSISAAVNNTLL